MMQTLSSQLSQISNFLFFVCPLFAASENKSVNGICVFMLSDDLPTLSCSPAVMEYQVQINSIKAKLQETRARKKQQEELIMKVENQALKVSSERVI